MPLQDKIRASQPSEGEKQVVREQARILSNQLDHLLSIHDFVEDYNQLDITPDKLHRVLFERTSLTPRGFQMRMTKASRASEVIGSMLQTKGYFEDIREDLTIEEFSEYHNINRAELFAEHGFEYGRRFQTIFEESVEEIFTDNQRPELSEFYTEVDSNTFDKIAQQFNKMSDWYESVLLEEGIISEGENNTPSFSVLIALCIIYLSGTLMIAIGYYEEDAFKILSGVNTLAIGYITFLAL